MADEFRRFQATDASGRVWEVEFLWQQNAISIRRGDSVDVKFAMSNGGERREKVVALPHPALLEASRKEGRPITDAWCSRLAAQRLKRAIETGEDIEKTPIYDECPGTAHPMSDRRGLSR